MIAGAIPEAVYDERRREIRDLTSTVDIHTKRWGSFLRRIGFGAAYLVSHGFRTLSITSTEQEMHIRSQGHIARRMTAGFEPATRQNIHLRFRGCAALLHSEIISHSDSATGRHCRKYG